MKKSYKAELTYYVMDSHPDLAYINNPKEKQRFLDIYYFDSEKDFDEVVSIIRSDMLLVVNGGYSLGHTFKEVLTINGKEC